MKKDIIREGKIENLTFEEIMTKYSNLCKKLSYKYLVHLTKTHAFEDCKQVADLWLWKAYNDYDIEKGLEFGTLAQRYIEQALQRETIQMNACKRQIDKEIAVHLDSDVNDEDGTDFHNLIGDNGFEEEFVSKQFLLKLIGSLSGLEKELFLVLIGEKKAIRVAEEQGVSRMYISKRLKSFKEKMTFMVQAAY